MFIAVICNRDSLHVCWRNPKKSPSFCNCDSQMKAKYRAGKYARQTEMNRNVRLESFGRWSETSFCRGRHCSPQSGGSSQKEWGLPVAVASGVHLREEYFFILFGVLDRVCMLRRS